MGKASSILSSGAQTAVTYGAPVASWAWGKGKDATGFAASKAWQGTCGVARGVYNLSSAAAVSGYSHYFENPDQQYARALQSRSEDLQKAMSEFAALRVESHVGRSEASKTTAVQNACSSFFRVLNYGSEDDLARMNRKNDQWVTGAVGLYEDAQYKEDTATGNATEKAASSATQL